MTTGVAERDAGVGPAPRRPAFGHRARWIAATVLAALVAVAILAATRPAVEATPFQSPLLGRAAPGFNATALDGTTVSLASYRGRFVVVNFFASWCPPCQQEMPELVRFDFQQHQHADGAALVGVVFQDSDAGARRFDQNWGTQWPSIPDPGGALALDYGVTSPPSTFLVDPRGRVVEAFTGPVTARQLTDAVAQARAAGR